LLSGRSLVGEWPRDEEAEQMIRVYINYPTSRVVVHADQGCVYFRRPEEPGHRFVKINPSTIVEELQRFCGKAYSFASVAEKNALWLEVDFGTRDFEALVVEHVRRLLAEHYTPFASAEVQFHCP
jgi:hypothetical protein